MANEVTMRTMECRSRLYDSIQLYLPKGQLKNVKKFAESREESVNHLVNGLLRRELGISVMEWKHPSE